MAPSRSRSVATDLRCCCITELDVTPRPYEPLTFPQRPQLLETLAARLHKVYQDEARRQAEMGVDQVRHPDDYDALPEHTKDYDRALALWVIHFGDQIRREYDSTAP